ncbi:hypothetical protein A2853_03250 [Candidatus Kaiserbacteria bacterium RIFCSPHIGHO2_01_FULL_55_17]|uniref:Uncharacterized protein n=1 Tax=Candidatus Kaiserbacteria bacterium RIFCSPHIGHO2_01_FULL_55_17 TaxID=1798484 RepID=A0A1F6D8Z9_9BACT|nr:MAG: hypothetical protein A2853_03250 [Candidatus Kaiserbacteria bacterium RIFCSPHIGHO2_01_FULL_55_17]
MTNLLSPQALREAQHFHRDRFILVGSVVSILCSTIALLALAPAYITVRTGDVVGTSVSPSPTLSGNTDREDLARARTLLVELQPLVSSTSSVLTTFDVALGARPSGITVSKIRYARGEPATIVIEGASRSREDINTYRTTLASDTRFSSVSVPIGALAGIEDGHFTMTLTSTF